MLKRTSITHINNLLEKKLNWKILDIGCGYRAHKNASVIADVKDFADFYKEKKFIQIRGKNLPFKDKFTTYHNLSKAYSRMSELLKSFEFTSFSRYITENN